MVECAAPSGMFVTLSHMSKHNEINSFVYLCVLDILAGVVRCMMSQYNFNPIAFFLSFFLLISDCVASRKESSSGGEVGLSFPTILLLFLGPCHTAALNTLLLPFHSVTALICSLSIDLSVHVS